MFGLVWLCLVQVKWFGCRLFSLVWLCLAWIGFVLVLYDLVGVLAGLDRSCTVFVRSGVVLSGLDRSCTGFVLSCGLVWGKKSYFRKHRNYTPTGCSLEIKMYLIKQNQNIDHSSTAIESDWYIECAIESD